MALLTLVITCITPSQAAPLHVYELNNSFADSLGGPDIGSNGGTLGPTGYTFGLNQGLNLSNPGISNSYSIDMTFSVNTISAADGHNGYVKLLDFKNLTSDSGLYIFNGKLDYFDSGQVANSATVLFTPGTIAEVRLNRDAGTNEVSAYVNGAFQFALTDSTNSAVFDAPGNIINFFNDDFATTQRESSAGFADSITIASAPVPETSTTVSLGLLLALSLGTLAVTTRKRVLLKKGL